ncbi:MAG: GAF domain-containing protein [Balneolales bacterium]|nr:GAF domain-containing protein [Balneolales bacterium]
MEIREASHKVHFRHTKNEAERIQDLLSYHILDTPEDEEFDALVKLACQICETKISQINFVDQTRQWNKATLPETPKLLPRGGSFCSTTILEDKWMIVPDASTDDRFMNYPFVKGDPNVRFYAGVNIKSRNGHNIGTICVLDFEPRTLSDSQLENLQILASAVQSRLELRYRELMFQKQASALREQTFFLENAADLTIVLKADKELQLKGLNGKLKDSFKTKDISPNSFRDLLYSSKSDQIEDLSWLTDLKSGEYFSKEVALADHNGHKKWFVINGMQKDEFCYLTAKDISVSRGHADFMKQSLKEKDALLMEVHHRVKNNLAIICGLLDMELMNAIDGTTEEVLQKCRARIFSIASIHETLYQTGNFASVGLESIIKTLAGSIRGMFTAKKQETTLDFDIDSVQVSINQAIPLSLIINELLTNSFKHAFDGFTGHAVIRVSLKVDGDNISLKFSDNGKGVEEKLLFESTTAGFTLVQILTEQLEGRLEISQNTEMPVATVADSDSGSGLSVTLSFKKEPDEVI